MVTMEDLRDLLNELAVVVEMTNVREPKTFKANAVVHVVALISVEESWEKPLLYHEMNATGTLKALLAALRKHTFLYLAAEEYASIVS